MSIVQNLALIKQEIDMALARRQDISGTGTDVKIVAVTKNQISSH